MKKQLQIRVRMNPFDKSTLSIMNIWDLYLEDSIMWDKLPVIDVMYIFI